MNLIRLLPRFRQAYRALPILQEREHWSRSDLEAFQLERLNVVWGHAITHVPHYRRMQVEARLPSRFGGLAEYRAALPVLPKAKVRTAPRQFLSDQAPAGQWRRTGGSTGTPMNAFWSKTAYQEMLRCKYRWLAMWGLDIFDRQAFLWGHSASFAPGFKGQVARWRRPLEDWLRRRLRLSAYQLGRHDLRRYLEQIAAFRPASLYGYSRALYLLAQEAEEVGIHCPALKLAILTGEPAFPHLVAAIERAFGIRTAIEYGSVECGVMALQWPDGTLRVREDRVLVETLPRGDGRFDLVVTVLDNPAFPLLRYDIADIADEALDRPDQGFAILHNVAGRHNDLLVTRTGHYVHSARFDALFKYDNKAIRRFRVQQHRDGQLSVAVEVDQPSAPLDVPGLEQKITELVEGYPVKLAVVDRIPQTAAGKHRLVVSDLDRVDEVPWPQTASV